MWKDVFVLLLSALYSCYFILAAFFKRLKWQINCTPAQRRLRLCHALHPPYDHVTEVAHVYCPHQVSSVVSSEKRVKSPLKRLQDAFGEWSAAIKVYMICTNLAKTCNHSGMFLLTHKSLLMSKEFQHPVNVLQLDFRFPPHLLNTNQSEVF